MSSRRARGCASGRREGRRGGQYERLVGFVCRPKSCGERLSWFTAPWMFYASADQLASGYAVYPVRTWTVQNLRHFTHENEASMNDVLLSECLWRVYRTVPMANPRWKRQRLAKKCRRVVRQWNDLNSSIDLSISC